MMITKNPSIMINQVQPDPMFHYNLLTYKYEWNTPIYIIGAIVIFAVSMLLQHFLKGFRIIYGIFACVVTSLLGPAFIGYDSNVKMYLTMAVCFGVTALWGIISWRCIIKK